MTTQASDHPREIQFSIITVSLNDLAGLQATYSSLVSQTSRPLQWIVADGGSTDPTGEWLSSVRYSPLTWTSRSDKGIYDGMNSALAKAEGDYVLFLNSGDMLAFPDTLEAVSREIGRLQARPSLVYGDSRDGDPRHGWHLRRAHRPHWVPLGMPASHQAMYFRRDAIGRGYDTSFRVSGDYAAVARLYLEHRGADFHYMPSVLCNFLLGGRAERYRTHGLKEDWVIRRSILGLGLATTAVLYTLHRVHSLVKACLPSLHRALRYG